MATKRMIHIQNQGVDLTVTIEGKCFSNALPAMLMIAVTQAVRRALYSPQINCTVESYEDAS